MEKDSFKYDVKYRRLYKYQTEEDVEYELPIDFGVQLEEENGWASLDGNILRVQKGASYDGASGPTFDTPNTMGPSLAHDFIYKILKDNGMFTFRMRRKGDKCFALMLKLNRMQGWRFRLWYVTVRIAGGIWA